MGKLVVNLDGATVAEYELTKDRYTIGRLPDNDIHLDNLAVSSHHAAVITILKDSFLEDLNSTNGTYVNGKLVKKHALQNGDMVVIGKYQIKFSGESTQAADDDGDDFEKTMVIRPGGAQAGTPSLDSVNQAVKKAGGAPIAEGQTKTLPEAKLQVLSGAFAGKELLLNKALTTLGRPGVQVAAVTRKPDGFYIVPVETGDGKVPLVNGKDIGPQAQKLENNDTIEIAGVKMGFFAA